MRIEWTQPALADFIEIQEYIEEIDAHAAQVIGQRIWDASRNLIHQPKMGRVGHVAGTREWVVQKTPAILVYRIESQCIEILHVYHDRQNWQIP